MKTPLTQLIDKLTAMQAVAPTIERNVYTKAIREAKEFIQIEEDAIKDAYNTAYHSPELFVFPETYFYHTYPKPETQGEE